MAAVGLLLTSVAVQVIPAMVSAATGPTFVQATASTTKTKFAFAGAVTAGDLLVAGITTNDGGTDPITGVSDSLNGAWAKLTSLRYGNGHVELYYLAGTVGGVDTVTFTGSQAAFTIAEYGGVQVGPGAVDQYASKASSGSTPTAGPTAGIGGSGELVIGVGGDPAPSSSSTQFTAGTGFTMRTQAAAPFVEADGIEDMVSTSSAGQTITMKSTASSYYGAIVAVFKTAPVPAPQAVLSVSPASGAVPLAVTADASASTDPIGISSYTFTFGDGTTVGPQSAATAAHTYSAGGKYSVQVTITDSQNATSSASAQVTVGAPVAALVVTPTGGVTPVSVTADASGSTDPIGIASYTFNFGDGSNPVGPQAASTAPHTYTTAGTYTVTVSVRDSTGASSNASASVTTLAPPTASLSVSPAGGAAPLSVAADASASTPGSNPISSYTFNFGDGVSAGPQSSPTAGHTYSAGGTYTLTVTVKDSAGNSSSAAKTVSVGSPNAALNVTPSSGGAPLAVTANASGSSDAIAITSYTFNFGDGSAQVGPQASASASHTYTTGGIYTATVTVTDGAGATATASSTVTVGSPHAALTVSPASGAAPVSVTADASSSSDALAITGYTFDFGDGTTVGPQSSSTATHVYTVGGAFTVRVTITDSTGASSSATKTVTIGAPIAAVKATPSTGGAPLNVTADASASTDPIGITQYTFNFGDGSAAVGPQPAATAAHTYTASGTYTVTVSVGDSVGASSSATTSVVVATPASAALTVTPSSGAAPLPVTADASGSTPGTNPIASYTFDFGDGTKVGPQAGATATHTYSAGGHYTVKVTVTDTIGVTSNATASVTASAPPTAALSVSPSSGATPLHVTADASASKPGSSPIASYTFNFGDGSPVVGPQAAATAAHTYGSAGTYTVTVTVTDTSSISASAAQSVTAIAPPIAALAVSPQSGAAPLSVTANASASTAGSNAIASYKFDFGDGSAAVGPQPAATAAHTYSVGGVFSVRVTVTDTAGFSSSVTQTVTAGAPNAKLAVTPSVGPVPLGVSADASGSSDPIGISSYTFNFGDGSPTVGPQAGATAAHTFSTPGVYTVTVTIRDSVGATSSATMQVSAVNPPNAALSVAPTLGTVPLAITADASGSTRGTNPIASYTFDFGDGVKVGPQPGATASHTYTAPGSYTLIVTVTDTQGVRATASAMVRAVTPPSAKLSVTPPSGGVPLAVTADASASTPGSNPIASFQWNWGDGSTQGSTAAPTSNHTYTTAGNYTVTVIVTDSQGISSSTTSNVTVVNPPNAAVAVTPTSGAATLNVTADASASTDPAGIASYTFDFGDGTPVVGPQASAKAIHAYTTAGNFTLIVTVIDTANASATATASVAVLAPPTASLVETPITGFAPLTVTADASGSAGGSFAISSYTFNFGDNTAVVGPQSSPTTSHVYAYAGQFQATVTVTDTQGNTSTATAKVNVSSGMLVQDSFTRANQTGWGTASNGMVWAPSSSAMSISGNEGMISSTASSLFPTLGTGTVADGNGLVRFSVASTSDTAGIALRTQSNGNMYLARYDGAGHLQFEYRVGSSWTHVAQVGFAPAVNAFYWLRFEVQGTNASLKIWQSGANEPSAWTWTGSVSAINSAGLMGLYGYAATGTSVQFDNFSVSAVGNPIPNSTITGTVTDATTGFGIAGVQVSTLPLTMTAVTNSAGSYTVNLPAGTFTVVFTGSQVGYNANFVGNVQAPINGSVSANQSLTPIPTQVAMDAYTRPNQSNGFGTSTDGHVWSNDLGVYPGAQAGITNSQAWVDTQASSQTDFDTWMGYQYENQILSVDLNMNTILVDPVYQHGARLLTRVQNSTTWVLMAIDPTAQDLELWVAVNNNWTELISVSQPISTNVWYHAKLATIGSTVEGKIWQFGTSEPTWQILASQKLLSGAGQGGLRTTGAYVQYANFQQVPVTQISGVVTSQGSGAPIANATVTLSNGASTTTDSAGNYTFTNLFGGSSYTVTASAPGENTASITLTPATATTAAGNIVLTP